jgi:hypothetical protein
MTLQTNMAWPSIDRLSTEIHLLTEVSALSVQVGRLFVSQWNMAREMRREIRALRIQVIAILHDADAIKLDPEDHFTDLLLRLQDQINQTVQIQRKQLQSPISLGARWMIQWLQRLLVASPMIHHPQGQPGSAGLAYSGRPAEDLQHCGIPISPQSDKITIESSKPS